MWVKFNNLLLNLDNFKTVMRVLDDDDEPAIMFEQENGITPFDFYSNLGIECNASTNNKKTDYVINKFTFDLFSFFFFFVLILN